MPEPSPALEPQKVIEPPKYSADEIKYLGVLAQRISHSQSQREQKWPWLDGMSYTEYWYANEAGANTLLKPKENREDSNYQSGTVRNKLMSLLAAISNLDLSPDISAYDKNDLEAAHYGEVIEDAMEKTADLEQDEDKKMRRAYELLKQGDVFVEEVWDELFIKDKKISKTFDGKLSGVTWATKLKRMWSRPSRNVVCGLNVYLGDYYTYDLHRQPYAFIVEDMSYAEAQAKFGEWERWEYVPKDLKMFAETEKTLALACLKLTADIAKDRVQVVKMQDPWNHEFAVILNGVLMTPVGLPLPWGCRYNFTQQGLEPINEKFAIHGSYPRRMKNNVALYDEVARLVVLKAQKSLLPPRFNLSGRIVSRRVFMPGAITSALNPGDVPKIDDGEFDGPNASEFNTLKFISDTIDKGTTNPVFSGQSPGGDPTATEVLEVQRQAKLMLGLTVAAVSMLEWKLAWLRLYNLLLNWFKPTGDRVEGERVVDTYRTTNVARPIDGKGMGRRVVVPTTDSLPSPEEIDSLEKQVSDQTGVPHKFLFTNPESLTDANLTWQINITPKEKRSSELSRIMFNKMASDAVALGLRVSPDHLEERFASVWEEDPTKLFAKSAPVPQEAPTVSPKVTMPAPGVAA